MHVESGCLQIGRTGKTEKVQGPKACFLTKGLAKQVKAQEILIY